MNFTAFMNTSQPCGTDQNCPLVVFPRKRLEVAIKSVFALLPSLDGVLLFFFHVLNYFFFSDKGA